MLLREHVFKALNKVGRFKLVPNRLAHSKPSLNLSMSGIAGIGGEALIVCRLRALAAYPDADTTNADMAPTRKPLCLSWWRSAA